WHAVPAQLHVVVQATANQVQMGIVQAWDYRPTTCVDDLRRRPALTENIIVLSRGEDLAVRDGHSLDERWDAVRGNLRMVQDDVGGHGILLATPQAPRCASGYLWGAGMTYSGNRVAAAPWTIV